MLPNDRLFILRYFLKAGKVYFNTTTLITSFNNDTSNTTSISILTSTKVI